LKRHQQQYDVLIFFTYLYATTVMGLEVAPHRSILVPTAHDEPAIRLQIYKDVFAKPAALCYLTESERDFVHEFFVDRPLLEDVTGVGIEIPQSQPYPRMPPAPLDDESDRPAEASRSGTGESGAVDQASTERPATDDDAATREYGSHILQRGSVFRRRHRLYGAIVLYGGRIDPGKGCEELLHYFDQYVTEGGDATLVLMGAKLMAL